MRLLKNMIASLFVAFLLAGCCHKKMYSPIYEKEEVSRTTGITQVFNEKIIVNP